MLLMPKSLASRLFLLFAVVLTVTVVSGASMFFRYSLTQRLEDAQYTANMLIEVMAQAVQESAIIGDYDAVKRTLETAVSQTPFDKSSFIDMSGGVIAVTSESKPTGHVPAWLTDMIAARMFDVNRAITVGGRDYGVLRLSFDIPAAAIELWTLIKGAAALTALCSAMGLLLVRLLLMRWLTNLNILKALEERVQIGELDAQAHLTSDAPLEIRQAVDIVNRTALSLRSQFGQRIDALMNALVQHKNALDRTAVVSEIDAQGRIALVNDLYCEKLGADRAELVGRPMLVDGAPFFPPNDIWRGEAALIGRDGAPIWFNRTVIPIFDAADAVEKWICIDIDVTAQKLAEEEARAAYRRSEELAERHFKAILDSVGDGVIIADRNGVIVDLNRATQEMFAMTRADLIGRPLTTLIDETGPSPTRDWLRDGGAVGLAGSVGRAAEEIGRRGDGETFSIELALGNLDEAGAPLYVGVVRDVTERKRAQENLRQAKEMAEAGSRAKSDFLATMSHEIRTPMNGVLGMLSLLDFEDLSPGQRDKVTVARQSAEALLSIVDDILDFSKLEAGRIQLEMSVCDPARLIESVAQVLRSRAEQKGLALFCRVDPDVPAAVATDTARVRQILNNLIGNAVKFTHAGHVEARLRRGRDLPDNRVELAFDIADTGIGIAPEAVSMLFQRFHQADNSITRRFGGTGLGLAICKDLCALLGGDIHVDSAPQKGSVFSFTIVCALADPSAVPVETNIVAGLDDVALPSRLSVLVVDDNAVNREIVKSLLQRLDHDVTQADSGLAAIDAARARNFDVILMDVQMPDMDGLTATRHIRALPGPAAETPIIAFTAHASDAVWDECAAAGMNAMTSKPVRIKPLLSAIAQAVQGRAVVPPPVAAAFSSGRTDSPSSPSTTLAAAPSDLLDDEHVAVMQEALGDDWAEIIDQFESGSAQLINALTKAVADGASLAAPAHTLKGIALNVGAAHLAAMAKTIEKAAPEQARPLVERLAETRVATLAALREKLA